MDVYGRFAAWFEASGLTRAEAATRLGCHVSMVGFLLTKRRTPGRDLAVAIERESAGAVPISAWAEAKPERHPKTEAA